MTIHDSWSSEFELIQIENRAHAPWVNLEVARDVVRLVAILRRVRDQFPFPHIPSVEEVKDDWDI